MPGALICSLYEVRDSVLYEDITLIKLVAL